MSFRVLLASLAISLSVAGCATKPPESAASLKTAYAASPTETKALKANDPVSMEPSSWGGTQTAELDPVTTHSVFGHHLAGRTLYVSSLSDIKLADKEVILTFDDGPMPGKTEHILAALDEFGVKASFMMVGEMAQAHPEIARKVLADGNTIGSHTFKHPDLDKMSFDQAMAEIQRGENAVVKAVGSDVNFFRFPYLADSKKLRAAVAMRDLVVMDVDVDSKDYFSVTPVAVMQRTMNELHKRGRGIILMHDIHTRTAAMLPTLLNRLEREGYKVVTLRYNKRPVSSDVVAQADTRTIR
ncbi:polysaccharide deacetylase family protein [Rhizobium sp. BK376]|jgi:peptidoglycan/xylan/chitin deacetylase (PgdA/CDA1 family)|uniref:polysaccharide deacetylase family protein n=1 Tax=Rhizobium sp. BK376 TaxID=2512149 RepID=UPI00104B5F4F|nr:polysaccharide deacetylase family protein [Rhizobium sp. BK376]TCR93009.1 peptidoglycan/xylan/chitin deacetylase (PgdA/CDA1 family) [Rhizobium sp. BK376]